MAVHHRVREALVVAVHRWPRDLALLPRSNDAVGTTARRRLQGEVVV